MCIFTWKLMYLKKKGCYNMILMIQRNVVMHFTQTAGCAGWWPMHGGRWYRSLRILNICFLIACQIPYNGSSSDLDSHVSGQSIVGRCHHRYNNKLIINNFHYVHGLYLSSTVPFQWLLVFLGLSIVIHMYRNNVSSTKIISMSVWLLFQLFHHFS